MIFFNLTVLSKPKEELTERSEMEKEVFMRAGDRFNVINHGKTSFDAETFSALYLPVIGRDAFALYQLLRGFTEGKIVHLLELLNLGLPPFSEALDKLSAIHLVKVFESQNLLEFELISPLAYERFLTDNFYRQLLLSQIGEEKLRHLTAYQTSSGKEISRKFHEVYAVNFDEKFDETVKSETFDLAAFKSLMLRQNLTFTDENREILQLYALAERFDLNWYELFKEVEQAANADQTINLTAAGRHLSGKSQPVPALHTFPKAYQELIIASKSVQPKVFLQNIKQQVGGFTSNDELKLLTNLSKQNLPDEVQNILIHYVLIQQKNATLTSNFVNTVANDWMRHKVMTAQAAITRILERNQQATEKVKAASPAKIVKRAPKWSNENYVENTSSKDQAKFEQYKKERKRHQEDN